MAKKLGKVKKPSAEKFEKGRKVFFLTLIFPPDKPEPEFAEMLEKYWQQVQEQVSNLEGNLAQVSRVYHGLIADSGKEGAKAVEEMEAGSRTIVKGCLERGAEFYPAEDRHLLSEFIDWNRCLSIGLLSRRALEQLEKLYSEVQKKRRERVAKIVDETLKSDEVGMLVMREGDQVQLPSDIQVFYVAPPALDEVRRWLREKGYSF